MEFVMQRDSIHNKAWRPFLEQPLDDLVQKATEAKELGTLFRPGKGGITVELADTPLEEEHEPAEEEEGHEDDNLLENAKRGGGGGGGGGGLLGRDSSRLH
eukprot:2587826-Amphidinium_carterae.1